MTLNAAVRSLDGERVVVLWESRERTISLERIDGILFANEPVPPPEGLRFRVRTVGGDHLVGVPIDGPAGELAIRLGCGATATLPAASIRTVEVLGGPLVRLSSLEPDVVEERPWFVDNHWPWRRDRCVDGNPLRVGGKTYETGIGVHSRCRLEWALDGEFTRFKALVGLDDSAPPPANVKVTILVDDEKAVGPFTLDAGNRTRGLDVHLAGARRLTLLVDYGEACDIGDRVNLVEAWLRRK
jgi:hypothetical protein